MASSIVVIDAMQKKQIARSLGEQTRPSDLKTWNVLSSEPGEPISITLSLRYIRIVFDLNQPTRLEGVMHLALIRRLV